MDNNYSNLEVCIKDLGLRGIYEGKEHRCRCQPRDKSWRRQRAGHDIASLIELCYVCVRGMTTSGSRWSWYGCDTCRRVNNQIATAILGKPDPGNQIFPLGRHSLMNRVALGLEPPRNSDEADRAVERLVALHELWDRLSAWQREEGQRLIEAAGFGGLQVVPLARWLEASPGSPGASADAMCRFIEEEDLPDLGELDELKRARELHIEGKRR